MVAFVLTILFQISAATAGRALGGVVEAEITKRRDIRDTEQMECQALLAGLNRACVATLFQAEDEACREIWDIEDGTYREILDAKAAERETYDPHMRVEPFSSEMSPGRVGDNILGILRTAQRRVVIASDKCTNEEFLDDLLMLRTPGGGALEIRVVTGEDRKTDEALRKYRGRLVHQSVKRNPDRSGKMHNKFIVIDEVCVITGSPNSTFSAYNYNVESFVAIYHRFVVKLYLAYYGYLVSGKNKYDDT